MSTQNTRRPAKKRRTPAETPQSFTTVLFGMLGAPAWGGVCISAAAGLVSRARASETWESSPALGGPRARTLRKLTGLPRYMPQGPLRPLSPGPPQLASYIGRCRGLRPITTPTGWIAPEKESVQTSAGRLAQTVTVSAQSKARGAPFECRKDTHGACRSSLRL